MANILSDVREGIGYLTVNRPNVLNALNGETIVALKDAFREFQIDDEVRVVILTGTGEKAFIAGADIKEMKSHSPSKAIASARRGQDLTNLIENFPKVVIAAVNGYALGGGCEVAMACHIRVASNNAMFGQPE
ncbi:MAG TPA: enoyl-CoA hydratase/isomerase family protein, partial [Candidatus Marinimicrobia bacterium]|nr:enoyl-CoA hydratase/isomerase family protein [Candidatus Neomarinimicrobiota bacterium]